MNATLERSVLYYSVFSSYLSGHVRVLQTQAVAVECQCVSVRVRESRLRRDECVRVVAAVGCLGS